MLDPTYPIFWASPYFSLRRDAEAAMSKSHVEPLPLPWEREAAFTRLLLKDSAPNGAARFHKPDLWHTFHLGVGKSWVASSLLLLLHCCCFQLSLPETVSMLALTRWTRNFSHGPGLKRSTSFPKWTSFSVVGVDLMKPLDRGAKLQLPRCCACSLNTCARCTLFWYMLMSACGSLQLSWA